MLYNLLHISEGFLFPVGGKGSAIIQNFRINKDSYDVRIVQEV